jgi:acetylornithine deacetylase/succinyl-diaminopimelate desuccinylase-like protein
MADAKLLAREIDFARLYQEAVSLLRDYLTIDTTNPPGDVSRAAGWVEALLNGEGVTTQRFGPSPEKPNVVATIGEGDASANGFVLAHHMDVVPVVRDHWTYDPFGGELHDGFIYGRGTLDMKGFGVMSLLAFLTLKRLGLPLRRPLRVLATADEEVGGIDGAKWLAAEHLDGVRGEFLLTEGSFARAGPRATYYAVQVAEKGVSTVKLTARGLAGHASAPREDNSVVRIGRALGRIGDYRSEPQVLHLARRYLASFPPQVLRLDNGRTLDDLTDDDLEELIATLSGGSRIQHMLRNTFSPTMVNAGLGQNVIPPSCEAFVDCRTVPGLTSDDLLAEIASVIDDGTIELELVKSSVGTESPSDSELFEAIRAAVLVERPEALVVPYLTPGGTDCKHFRPKGIVCYGLIPFELDDKEGEGIHGVNERVSVENLERGLRILLGTVVNLCVAET